MKKRLVLFTTCAALLLSGCSASKVARTVKDAAKTASNLSESMQSSPSPTPESTPAPKESKRKLGKKGTVGDWKICVKKVASTKKIKNGEYRYYSPKKGNSYVYFTFSVRNTGKTAQQFLPRVGYENTMLSAFLYYKGEYEYKPTELLSYDKDLIGDTIQPLTTENGIIAFEVPKKVAKNKKQLTLKIGTKTEYLIYSAK